jgi:hypothetical protein
MMTFYKISKTDANKVGIFEFGTSEMFNPFCSEQVDGTYLVSVDLVERLKDNKNIQKVDFSKLTVITEKQIQNKVIELFKN